MAELLEQDYQLLVDEFRQLFAATYGECDAWGRIPQQGCRS